MIETIILDWDGTISESSPGITRSVQYALHTMGIEEPDLSKLNHFIGPPLNVEFRKTYNFNDAEIRQAVTAFRERYNSIGKFECQLYPGMKMFLTEARLAGKLLVVASSKPDDVLHELIPHLGLDGYFVVSCGSDPSFEMDNKVGTNSKEIVLRQAIDKLVSIYPSLKKEDMVMVGDTPYDIMGARANNIDSLAVTYGYGERDALQNAGAGQIAENIDDLRKYLLS